jgi:Complex I intermediate-associated protein 30 (CIA30)
VRALADAEGLVFNVLADGKPYIALLKDDEGHTYAARFFTRLGYANVRLPLNVFRAEVVRGGGAAPPPPLPLRPERVVEMRFRCGRGVRRAVSVFGPAAAAMPGAIASKPTA